MKTVAIIQARMGSTRLPGKILKNLDGQPALAFMLNRVKLAKTLDEVIVATTVLPQDDLIVSFCHDYGVKVFRGSETDVLSRYYECAKKYEADVVVRLTADCPFSDPLVIDQAVSAFLTHSSNLDYLANTIPIETSFFPDGSDVEVFSMLALKRAYKEAKSEGDREHVTFYFWKGKNGFATAQLPGIRNLSQYRFTLDYSEDFKLIERLIELLKQRGLFGHLEEITSLLDEHPSIKALNQEYCPGMGW